MVCRTSPAQKAVTVGVVARHRQQRLHVRPHLVVHVMVACRMGGSRAILVLRALAAHCHAGATS